MTNDLKRLMQESVADAPAEPHTVASVVQEAQRRQRSHTVRTSACAALAMALVVGVGYAAIARTGSDDAQPVERHEDVLINLDDARPAKPGEDYEVLARIDDGLLPGPRWSPDDMITLMQGEDADEYAALSGTDGETIAALPSPGGGNGAPVYVGQGKAVWEMHRGDRIALHIWDLTTREWSIIPVEAGDGSAQPIERIEVLGIERDSVWIRAEEKSADEPGAAYVPRSRVLSAPVAGTGELMSQIDGKVFRATLADGNLAWVAGPGEPVRVRDLATGEEREVGRSARDCVLMIVGLANQRVATNEQCMGGSAVTTTAWSLNNDDRFSVQGHAVPDGGLSDTAMILQTTRRTGHRLLTYVYRFDTGEALKLSDVSTGPTGMIVQLPAVAGGDRLTFPDPAGGNRMLLARLE